MILGPKEMEAAGPVLDKLKQEMERLEAQKNSHPYRLNSARLEDAIPMPDDPEERWDEWKAAQAAYNAARPADLIAIESDYLAAYKAYKSAYKSYVMKMYSEVPKDPESIIEFAKIQTRLYADSEYRRMPAEYKGTELYSMFNFEDGEFRLDKMYIFLYVNSGLSLMIREYPDLENDIQQAIIQTINELPYVGDFMPIDNGILADEDLPSIKTSIPRIVYWPTDKTSNAPFVLSNDVTEVNVNTSGSSKRYSGTHLEIERTEGLTPFDRDVHEAITTLYKKGDKYFTPGMIFTAMTNGSSPSKDMSALIVESIDRLRGTYIKIDATNEVKTKGFDKLIYGDYALSARKCEAIINGKRSECYEFNSMPILSEYAEGIHRIASAPIGVLGSPIDKTKETIVLQGEIKRRVYAAKNRKSKMSNVIRYESLYNLIGLPVDKGTVAVCKKKQAIRKKTKKILDHFKSMNEIKSYQEKTEGREIVSVKFLF